MWKKGQSGNPGGMPKDLPRLKQMARELYPEAIAIAMRLARGDYSTLREEVTVTGKGKSKKIVTRIRRKQVEVPPQVALDAIALIADRALGKAVQPIAGADPGDGFTPINRIEHVILKLESDDRGTKRITQANFDPRVIEHEPVEKKKTNGRLVE